MKNGSLREVIKAYAEGHSEPYTNPGGSLYFDGDVLYSYGQHFPLAVRLKDGNYLLNGDRYSSTTAKHQSYTMQEIHNSRRVEIPFSALAEIHKMSHFSRGYNVDEIRSIRLVDWENDTYLDSGRVNKDGEVIYIHVLGGCVMEYKGHKYLSGMDETGTAQGRYFLTQLVDDEVDTVVKALESLKPEVVKIAEEKSIQVLRQGEWFFIPVGECELVLGEMKKDYVLPTMTGDSGHHKASEGTTWEGRHYVKGIIKHTQGDHKQVKLYEVGTKAKDRKWYSAHHNVQVMSFNAVGNVD